MIPRALVARALGLPEETDALPPGDLPLDRFAARYVAYLGTEEPGTETPDAWTGVVMDALIAEEPELAFAALRAGLPIDEGGRLADPLAELGALPGWAERIEEAAEDDPALAARLDTGG
ncbi:hypothetical protein [Jannaschia formosa]|uniref:hypothetical protein n=1 Tax=Jannaschia formosa TaxID=2259592 RepID=UPI000E1BD0E3|nr:hypothetical protein [Jannaschia formosa]TFL17753.1 hypothetical protein DR046_12680 [Jannaschia formosa]